MLFILSPSFFTKNGYSCRCFLYPINTTTIFSNGMMCGINLTYSRLTTQLCD